MKIELPYDNIREIKQSKTLSSNLEEVIKMHVNDITAEGVLRTYCNATTSFPGKSKDFIVKYVDAECVNMQYLRWYGRKYLRE